MVQVVQVVQLFSWVPSPLLPEHVTVSVEQLTHLGIGQNRSHDARRDPRYQRRGLVVPGLTRCGRVRPGAAFRVIPTRNVTSCGPGGS